MPNKAHDDDLVMNMVELALMRTAGNREAFLRSTCGGDSELFNQVWRYVQWEERMEGFLLEPLCPALADEHPFEPGDLLDDRFRIVREVAQGGMGIVYEAFDEKLQRRIALKYAKAGFRKRLSPEVRNATAISHPNVCKTFEIHTASTPQGEIDFLTMEFLEGETLAERLSRDPVSEKEARTIARQLCAGLAEAHRNQVIHGDLKSNNVILTTTADGAIRAVITDFGMARSVESAQPAMQSAPAGGTPDYMAPELWKGETATVASDIYALGVILSKLGSGRMWEHIRVRCLDPVPSRRFPNADAVAHALVPIRSRRWFLVTAAAIVVAAITGPVTYQRASAPKEVIRLAMLPLLNSADLAPIADSVFREASRDLAKLQGGTKARYSVIPMAEVQRAKVDTPEKAKSTLKATHLLRGTLTNERGRVLLHAMLTDIRSGIDLKDWTVQYKASELRYAPIALAGMVTSTLRLPPMAINSKVNDSARHDYLTGLSYVRDNIRLDDAVALLERAVASDPDSPLTYAGLAEAQAAKYFATHEVAWREKAQESVRQAELRDLDLPEVHLISGWLKTNSSLYELAVADFQRVIELQPNNDDAYRRLGMVYDRSNQLSEALVAFQKAAQIQPSSIRNHRELGTFYIHHANYKDAIEEYRKVVNLAPNQSNAHFTLASALRQQGRFMEAESELRVAIGLQDTSVAEHALGYTLMLLERDKEAILCYLRALAIGPETALLQLNLGISYSRVGRYADARAAFERGMMVAQRDIADPRNGRERAQVAYLAARLEDRQRAESELAQALQLWPDDSDTRWMAVLTYEALGHREDTLGLLASSPSGILIELSRYPDVVDLRRDPRFLALLASKHSQ